MKKKLVGYTFTIKCKSWTLKYKDIYPNIPEANIWAEVIKDRLTALTLVDPDDCEIVIKPYYRDLSRIKYTKYWRES